MESVDDVLHLSKSFGLEAREPGILVVEFVFSIVWQLIDASLDDEGLLELAPRKDCKWPIKSQDMEIGDNNYFDEKTAERHEGLRKMNTLLAIEVTGDLFRDKVTSRILYLAQRNMLDYYLSHRLSITFGVFYICSHSDVNTWEYTSVDMIKFIL